MNVLAATASQVALQQHETGIAAIIIGVILLATLGFKSVRTFWSDFPLLHLGGSIVVMTLVVVVGAFLA